MPIRSWLSHTLRMPVRLGSTTFPIRRCAKGRGFSYYAVGGKRTSDQATLQRIRSLGVSPAWTEVWICPNGDGGSSDRPRSRGREQYRCHDDWREVRDRNKYERILDFARLLPDIRERIATYEQARSAVGKGIGDGRQSSGRDTDTRRLTMPRRTAPTV